jgi:hypothetical protein
MLLSDTMKKLSFILTIMAFAALLAGTSFAQQCLESVTASSSISKATTGTDVTVTVTTSGSSCTINTLVLVSSPELTINDPASGQYSGFSAGTTKTFSITGGTANTYSYYARGTTSSGSVDSTSKIIEFISPSDMTVSADPSSKTLGLNDFFNLTIDVTNSNAESVTTSYALNLPTGMTRTSGNPVSSTGTSIGGSSTKSFTFEIKHSTCFEGSKTITFDIGNSQSATSSVVTSSAACSTPTPTPTPTPVPANASSDSSSGSGGSTTTSTPTPTPVPTPSVKATFKPGLEKAKGLLGNAKLKTAIEKILNIASLSDEAKQNLLDLSEKAAANTEITRDAAVYASRTTITTKIKYKGVQKAKNFMLFDTVPKEFASSSGQITVTAPGASIEVVNTDPEYLFTYKEVLPGQEFAIDYEVGTKLANVTTDLDNLITGFSAEVYTEEFAESACTDGQLRCSDNDLSECTGGEWVLKETCEFGCQDNACLAEAAAKAGTNDQQNISLAVILIIAALMAAVAVKNKDQIKDIVKEKMDKIKERMDNNYSLKKFLESKKKKKKHLEYSYGS